MFKVFLQIFSTSIEAQLLYIIVQVKTNLNDLIIHNIHYNSFIRFCA